MLIKLTDRGVNKAVEIATTGGATNLPQRMLVEAEDIGPTVDSSEIGCASEDKVAREFRRWISMGLAEDMGGDSRVSHVPRHEVLYREPEPKKGTGEKVASGLGNTVVGLLKGAGRAFVGTAKYVNKRGLEGMVIGNTEALVGGRRGREARRLERLRRDRESVLRGRRY